MPAGKRWQRQGEQQRGKIIELIQQNPLPPTQMELAAELGIKHTAIRQHLGTLREEGLVDWYDGKPRTLHLTKLGQQALSAS